MLFLILTELRLDLFQQGGIFGYIHVQNLLMLREYH